MPCDHDTAPVSFHAIWLHFVQAKSEINMKIYVDIAMYSEKDDGTHLVGQREDVHVGCHINMQDMKSV